MSRTSRMAQNYSPLIDEETGFGGKEASHVPDAAYSFAEKTVRLGFQRKVFGILSAQLALTLATVMLFTLHGPTKAFVFASPWLFWVSFASSFGLIIAMGVSEKLRRQHPRNLITLGIFTLAESILVGYVSAAYAPAVVMAAVGITTGVVGGLTLFTMQSKLDLTPYSGALFSFFTALFFASIIQMFVHARVLHLLICVGGVIMFSVYLVFDVQLVMGGHKYALGPDEYVFAALNLYLDIINLFLYILQLLNSSRD